MRPIIVCGIPRSGSTLVGQIFQEVFPDQEIPKTHPVANRPPDENSRVALVIRDPRDVVASLYRIRISRGGEGVGGPKGLENVLKQTQIYYDVLPEIQRRTEYILIRYENFVHDYDIIYACILMLTGRSVSEEERKRINTKFSLKANRERASRLKDFNEKGVYEIHGDHIGPVEPGHWCRTLPDWAVERVGEFCKPIAMEWDYE